MAVLDDPSTEMLPGGPAEAPAAVSVSDGNLVGRTLGKFVIVEKLGRGGSGDVYRAEQPALGRSAVVKVLRRGTAPSATKIDRFLREAKLASRLDHPYAAHVYAFGAEPDGELWIAMEYVRGATLDELVARRGPVPPQIFGPLFGRICEVVHTAHELGIVHRDIKGSNVMVIERAGQLLPKLLDFGIAKSDGAEPQRDAPDPPTEDKELTQEGATLGSPHYMSPEQWLSPADVDARADIYALGVLAYRCVTGAMPFRAADRMGLIEAHLHAPPPRLPERVPAGVADAIVRALEKDKGARWQTALAFGETVQRAVGSTAGIEVVPIFDPYTRDVWLRAGPQPLADAVARVAGSPTVIDCELAVRELVAITCRWLALLALAALRGTAGDPDVRDRARDLVGGDDAQPWLELARAIARARQRSGTTAPGATISPGLTAALLGSDALAALAEKLDDDTRSRSPGSLALDVAAAADALRPLEPLLAYQLVVGKGEDWAESWIGVRRSGRERVVVWGDPLADGEVALLDAAGKVVARLSPLAQVVSPLPSAEPELFLLWRGSRGHGPARLVAAPWGFEIDDDAAGERLAALATEETSTDHDDASDVSPYPGLAAYRERDAERFVGREREIEALANRLVRAPMIAVLGPSGAGKSSFIHAGLVPRLEGNGYRVVTMRPGRHPMHALAALPPMGADSLDGADVVARLREAGEGAARGLVIVVDQLEEVVTLCGDGDERRRFADALAAAADDSNAPVRVVVTLRDDFAAVIESVASIRGKFEVFVLGPPPPEALRRIVVEPARRQNVTVDPTVVDDMVREVAGRPASLPLLSFTAAELWRTRDKAGRRIAREAYDALGGVAGALSTYADQVYDSLARRDQLAVRELFGRLVAADGTRIPAPRAELEQLPGAGPVLANLIDARLLVVREDESRDDAGDVVEIVHECLAERWDRLAQWRREDAADRALLGDVRAAARRWDESGRKPDMLWRGESLAELRRLGGDRAALTDLERAFAGAATAADRRARKVRMGAVGVVIAALAGIAGVMAYLSIDAKRSRDEADARLTASLVAQGTSQLNDGRELAALAYFAEAMRRGADGVGLREMIAIASRGWKDTVSTQPGVLAVAALPGEVGFLAGTRDSHLRWIGKDGAVTGEIDVELGPITAIRAHGEKVMVIGDKGVAVVGATCCKVVARVTHEAFVHGAAMGPGADEISTLEKDGVHVYGVDGAPRRSAVAIPGKTFADIAFDPAGTRALVWSEGQLVAIDLVTMVTTKVADDVHGELASSADDRTFAYVDEARGVHVVDVKGEAVAPVVHPANRASSVWVSATGDRVLAMSEHEATVIERTGKEVRSFAVETAAGAMVRGDDVWTTGHDGKVRRYHAGVLVASVPAHAGDVLGWDLAGDRVATQGSDGLLVVTRAEMEQFAAAAMPCERTTLWAVQYGIMSMCEDGRVRLAVGSHYLGTVKKIADDSPMIAWRADVGVGAIEAADVVSVVDASAREVAASSGKVKPLDVQVEDEGHLLVLENPEGPIWRWAFREGEAGWVKVMDAAGATSIGAVAGGGIAVAYEDGHVSCFAGGAELWRLDAGGRTAWIAVSRDGRRIALQLVTGAVVIADAVSGVVTQRLPAGDATDVAPSFDETGEMLIRPAAGVTTIWDVEHGLPLVTGLDLLKVPSGVVFASGGGGGLELQGERTGELRLTRDTRAAEAVLEDIACHVPLAVVKDRLEPVTPTRCPR